MNHIEYIMKKQNETCREWQEIMTLNGMFKDLEKIREIKKKLRVVIT